MHYYLTLKSDGTIIAKQESPATLFVPHLNAVSEEVYAEAELEGKYIDGKLYPPPEPPAPNPREVSLSRMNFMLRLDDCGYLDAVEKDVDDGKLTRRAKIMWDNAEEFERLSPELDQWAADLGFTSEQLDEVFQVEA